MMKLQQKMIQLRSKVSEQVFAAECLRMYVFHFKDNLSKDDDVPDTNGEEEFEEQNPDDYKSAVSD